MVVGLRLEDLLNLSLGGAHLRLDHARPPQLGQQVLLGHRVHSLLLRLEELRHRILGQQLLSRGLGLLLLVVRLDDGRQQDGLVNLSLLKFLLDLVVFFDLVVKHHCDFVDL